MYKILAMLENVKRYPNQMKDLPDPSGLSIRYQTSVRKVYGGNRRFNTIVYQARSTVRGHEAELSDRQNMSFMVNVQKWLRGHFCQQTIDVLESYISTEVHTTKKQKLNGPQ